MVTTNNRNRETALFDFWRIRQDDDEIEGELTNRWSGLTTYNYIERSKLMWPCRPEMGSLVQREPIAEGATLTGTLTDDDVELELLGQSLDGELRFRAVFEAERE
jgi:hypothetical protein